jgi:hypothetical protein
MVNSFAAPSLSSAASASAASSRFFADAVRGSPAVDGFDATRLAFERLVA